jgi:hypothetical protein
MSDTLLSFQKFNDPQLAATISEVLQAQGIPTEVVNEAPAFDISFANNRFEPTIQLKLAPADFTKARAALLAYYRSQLKNLDANYYLFSFTNAELLDIIKTPDEWGDLDYALARELLAERGEPVTTEQEAAFHRERLTILARPERTHPLQVLIGYLCALLFGVFGFILGYIFAFQKKTLPNGERVYLYPPGERRHGKYILILSAISLSYFLWALLNHQ